MMIIKSILGNIKLTGETGLWQISASSEIPETGIELIHLRFSTSEAAILPQILLEFSTPQIGMHTRWSPQVGLDRCIPQDSKAPVPSSLASSIPIMQIIDLEGENRILAAVSDAMRYIKIQGGVCERTNEIHFSILLFSIPEAPISSCELTLRLDTRKIFYADAIRSAMDWYCTFPEYAPVHAPEAAFDPLYSSWYSYHKDLFDTALEQECVLGKEYGLKGIIVDDGWQTDDPRDAYAFCGDWKISRTRFKDMVSHVRKIHDLGMKYILWYAVPLLGEKSKNFERFKHKCLYGRERLRAYILDPRFPEVREFLINTYETALKEWHIDGFKLDFIDSFRFNGEDPAIKENYAGRDIRSLPAAIDKLLSDVMARLRKIKPDILIEFRQSYIGPAIRKYGNMLRALDCAADIYTNRARIIDLRLTSGETAVHSDMLEWHNEESPEEAALQFLNILFSVPQISVRLAEIPESHRKMLRFWLDFWMKHRDVLLHGYLKPYHPEINYPVVSAENEEEKIIAAYLSDHCIDVECAPGKNCYAVNASGRAELILELKSKPVSAELFDTFGNSVPCNELGAGFIRVPVPASGLLKMKF